MGLQLGLISIRISTHLTPLISWTPPWRWASQVSRAGVIKPRLDRGWVSQVIKQQAQQEVALQVGVAQQEEVGQGVVVTVVLPVLVTAEGAVGTLRCRDQ